MSSKVEIFLLLRGKELIKKSDAIPSSGFYLCFIRPIVLLISAQRENIFSTFPLANKFFAASLRAAKAVKSEALMLYLFVYIFGDD